MSIQKSNFEYRYFRWMTKYGEQVVSFMYKKEKQQLYFTAVVKSKYDKHDTKEAKKQLNINWRQGNVITATDNKTMQIDELLKSEFNAIVKSKRQAELEIKYPLRRYHIIPEKTGKWQFVEWMENNWGNLQFKPHYKQRGWSV